MQAMNRELYLGTALATDALSGDTARVSYPASDLTTHGVIVGMTGSGKTGLGVVLLEELARAGVPTLILDPKGDIANLALIFPALDGPSFRPWIDEAAARRAGVEPDALAQSTAARWRDGLALSGLGPDDVRALREAARIRVFSPGSTAATPLNMLGSLAAPAGGADTAGETARDEIESVVSGLLGLLGITGDPLTSREHILLSNLIEHAWTGGRSLDLPTLLRDVQTPPLRKLGVLELDAFYPAADRAALALRLNGLLASPGFAPWLAGEPADIGSLLYAPDGQPSTSVIYLAHLSEPERQLVVTLLLSRVASWMQTQPGTSALRALVYMDEVYGFAPPSAAPPAKKPILTLLKQARAFGIGLVLSTQNPVDLDYKAMSNAGTWMIGRLQTERDKLRIVEALRSASGDADLAALDARISGLGKREFVLHSAHGGAPRLFTTRWAMSFLRGPLTKAELARLPRMAAAMATTAGASASNPATAAALTGASPSDRELAEDETRVAPEVAPGVPVRYLSPDAPWRGQLELDPQSPRVAAALVARVRLSFDEQRAGLDHCEEWEAIAFPLGPRFEPARMVAIDIDARDFRDAPGGELCYAIPEAPIGTASYFRDAHKALAAHVQREQRLTLLHNRELALYSRPGESRAEFLTRCERAADERADAETAKLRDQIERALGARQRALATAKRQVAEAAAQHSASRTDEVVGGVGSLLGALLGGRSSTRSLARAAARSARGVSSRRVRTARAAARVDAAEDKVVELEAEVAELEHEVASEATAIDARWREAAAAISALEIGLEKSDVDIVELALAWLPTARR
jgi:hypothetical protein